jgi:peptide/nickel transport system ATP-binding protein
MYAARIQEEGEVRNLFRRPNHPYTWGLLGSLPRLHQDVDRLVQISGQPPSLLFPPQGCRFHPRCPYVMPICSQTEPTLDAVPEADGAHRVRCHLDQDTKDHEAAKLVAGTFAEAS